MHVWEGVTLALQQIWQEKLKSFFSVLGVILGVMFLIVVVTVVEGLDRYVREDVTSQVFGVNTVTLRRMSRVPSSGGSQRARERARRPPLRFADAEAIQRQLSVPARVAVENNTRTNAVGDNGALVTSINVAGASADIFQIRDLEMASGRAFTHQEEEAGTPVVVIGSETAELMYPGLAAVGRSLRIRGFPYRIVGVIAERGSLLGQSLDNIIIAPARSPIAALTAPGGRIQDIIIQTIDADRLREAQLEVEGIMRVRRQLRPTEEPDFSLETADEAISFWDNISRMLFTALPMLVSIALVVGGIVIMNIMLVSVMERTREIGVRKALGARRRDILTQVLIESVTLSTIGAAFGVAAGIGIAELVAAVSAVPAAAAPRWIAAGILLGLGVGVVAGVYPASRAARLDPVDALRYE